ncbi:MAG TPA: hypothetical protein VEY71_11080 [Chitinophagales bacterium]|nr:hypothetical protein [Chitinophagales bacterium]
MYFPKDHFKFPLASLAERNKDGAFLNQFKESTEIEILKHLEEYSASYQVTGWRYSDFAYFVFVDSKQVARFHTSKPRGSVYGIRHCYFCLNAISPTEATKRVFDFKSFLIGSYGAGYGIMRPIEQLCYEDEFIAFYLPIWDFIVDKERYDSYDLINAKFEIDEEQQFITFYFDFEMDLALVEHNIYYRGTFYPKTCQVEISSRNTTARR